jgi:two-component system sensor histidine kinase DegS
MYGLKPAFEELADNLMERSGDKIKIKVNVQANEERLPLNIEQHLFRIVQEACENALRHAGAKTVTLFGTLTSTNASMTIEDDGTGFDVQSDLNNLIANNHFGLAGMVERSHLIDAEINIQSKPSQGTSIQITWKKNPETN